jgi:hypothetical protein
MAEGVPDYPADIGPDGAALWRNAWNAAITWISPATDTAAVEHAAHLADDIAEARRKYRATRDPKDGRMVVQFAKALSDALADLGFNPVARAKLGVAEVTRVSKLDALRRRG